MDEKTCSIGEAARLTGVSIDTLRYYERVGLLAPVARSESGHRRYDWVDLAWVRFFTILRTTGMPIRSMLAFAELEREGDPTLDERRALLEEHRGQVARRIEELERSLGTIDAKIAHYRDVSNTCIYPLDAQPSEAAVGGAEKTEVEKA
jgi:DNA-binding transcriptional MerR regulator